MKRLICMLLLVCCLLLVSCNSEEDYYKKTEWNCSDEEFKSDYCEYYFDKIEELKAKYEVECEYKTEFENADGENVKLKIYLYNDVFTIIISLVNEDALAYYRVVLHYYGYSEDSLKDFEVQRPLVNLINDFTNEVAFDTKNDKNHFEALYNECSEEKNYASNIYHSDSVIGNVGYKVILNTDAFGYYYKMQNTETDILCNHYRFDGLLKPL